MFCEHCGMRLQDDWVVCPGCGVEVEREDAESVELGSERTETLQQNTLVTGKHDGGHSNRIVYRSFWKYIVLSLVTCGIYGIYVLYGYVKDVNKVCAGDGKESKNYIVVWLLSVVTLGIYGLYWWYTQGNRLYSVAPKYGVKIHEKGSSILLWHILGCSVIPILGMFVATYIMFDNMNAIAKAYNGDVSADGGETDKLHPHLIRNILIGYGIVVVLVIALLAFVIKSIFVSDFSEELNPESRMPVDYSDMDLEFLLSQSEEALEDMGFVYDDEEMNYQIQNGDVLVSCLDGKIYMMTIMGDKSRTPSFHSVKIGMPLRDAETLLLDDYENTTRAEKYYEYYNRDSGTSVLLSYEAGIVTEMLAIQMPEDFWDMEISEDLEDDDIGKTSEYVIEDSASRYLTDADVKGLTLQEINYAKNEIYARHGRRFNSKELQDYFDSMSWYVGKYSPEDFDQNYSGKMLNDYEKKNAEFLRDKEFAINPNGYQLDAK